MTTIQPPSYLQAGQASARSDRLTIGALLNPGVDALSVLGGVRPTPTGQGLLVTSTGTSQVAINAGTAFVPGGAGGVYVCHNDGVITLSVQAPHATMPRRDLIIARVLDNDNGALLNQWDVTVLPGVPATAGPAAPTVPGNAIALAEVLVRPGYPVANIAVDDVTDRRGNRTVALGGVVPVTSTTIPANPYAGMVVSVIDTGQLRLWTGAKWMVFNSGEVADTGAWQNYTPDLTGSGINPTIGAGGSRTGRYRLDGKTIEFRATVVMGSTFAPGTGPWLLSLLAQHSTAAAGPSLVMVHATDASAGTYFSGTGIIDPGAIGIGRIHMNSPTALNLGPTTPFGWAANDVLTITGTYEAA
jgi:hypothetical protein